MRSINVPLNEADPEAMTAILAQHAAAGRAEIEAEGVPVEDIVAVHEADLLFRGQSHVFRTPLASAAFDPDATLAQFAAMYRERFDIELGGMRAMLANLRTTVFGVRPTLAMDVFAPRETVSAPRPRASARCSFRERPSRPHSGGEKICRSDFDHRAGDRRADGCQRPSSIPVPA